MVKVPSKVFNTILEHNPHLKWYIDDYEQKNKIKPEFHELLDHDMGTLKNPNIIYPVGDPIFIHIHKTEKTGLRYVSIEPELTMDEKEKKVFR